MTIIRVIDFETTGFPPRAGVCEAGWTDIILDGGAVEIRETVAKLCNPGMTISPEAEIVHGISDEMVIDAPAAAKVFAEMARGVDAFCAHNAEFEQKFFGGGDTPWICTYKLALALHPRLPNHKNGDIPRHLGISLDADRSAPLHRAGPDTYVTARILERFLSDGLTFEDALKISNAPKQRMPFGKYKGMLFSDLPMDYLIWARENMNAGDVRAALVKELDKRRAVSGAGAGRL